MTEQLKNEDGAWLFPVNFTRAEVEMVFVIIEAEEPKQHFTNKLSLQILRNARQKLLATYDEAVKAFEPQPDDVPL